MLDSNKFFDTLDASKFFKRWPLPWELKELSSEEFAHYKMEKERRKKEKLELYELIKNELNDDKMHEYYVGEIISIQCETLSLGKDYASEVTFKSNDVVFNGIYNYYFDPNCYTPCYSVWKDHSKTLGESEYKLVDKLVEAFGPKILTYEAGEKFSEGANVVLQKNRNGVVNFWGADVFVEKLKTGEIAPHEQLEI